MIGDSEKLLGPEIVNSLKNAIVSRKVLDMDTINFKRLPQQNKPPGRLLCLCAVFEYLVATGAGNMSVSTYEYTHLASF